jgi:hypothetical protein
VHGQAPVDVGCESHGSLDCTIVFNMQRCTGEYECLVEGCAVKSEFEPGQIPFGDDAGFD